MEYFIIILSILLTYSLLRQIVSALFLAFSRVKNKRLTKRIKKLSSSQERQNRLTTFEVSNDYQKKFYNGDPEYFRFVKSIDDLFKTP